MRATAAALCMHGAVRRSFFTPSRRLFVHGYAQQHAADGGTTLTSSSSPLPSPVPILTACDALVTLSKKARRGGSVSDEKHVFAEFTHTVNVAMQASSTELRLTRDNLDMLIIFLATLSSASEALVQQRLRHQRASTSFLDTKLEAAQLDVTSSPYLRGAALDFVSAVGAFCLQESHLVQLATPHQRKQHHHHHSAETPSKEEVARLYEVIHHCVQLEVCDLATIASASRALMSKPAALVMSNDDLVDALHVVTLCHKRRRMPLASMDPFLLRLQAAKDLNGRQLLMVLSSLARVHRGSPQNSETSKILSRRLGVRFLASMEHGGPRPAPVTSCKSANCSHDHHGSEKGVETHETFSNKDIVFALRVATLSEVVASFISVTMEQTVVRCHTLTPEEIGNVCKYLKKMHTSPQLGHITRNTCGKETRRLLPRLLTRTNDLLGQFSLRDARHVLECLDSFQQRHSVIFSQLTPFVSGVSR